MKIYAVSGLGADERVFQYLDLDVEVIPIKWLKPEKNESIKSYSLRMSEMIDSKESFSLMGVSFGGLICVEINKILKPNLTILISSVELSREIPYLYRFIGKTGLINLFPALFFNIPKKIAHFLFGSKNIILDNILNDTDPSFTKWALNKLLVWKNQMRISHCVKIGGSSDKLLPPKDIENTKIVDGGGHFMIVDRAAEVTQIINEKVAMK